MSTEVLLVHPVSYFFRNPSSVPILLKEFFTPRDDVHAAQRL